MSLRTPRATYVGSSARELAYLAAVASAQACHGNVSPESCARCSGDV